MLKRTRSVYKNDRILFEIIIEEKYNIRGYTMKCEICKAKKGKRICIMRNNALICSSCCGCKRNIINCNSNCEYYWNEDYNLIPTGSMELTEVGRGKVILFSESLFLPNILECLYMDIEDIEINIKNPILISLKLKFKIKKSVIREVKKDEVYLKDKWKRQDKLFPFLSIYTLGTGEIENEKLLSDNIEQKLLIENNHAEIWLPLSKIKTERITKEQRNEFNIPPDILLAPVSKGKYFLGKNNTFFSEIDFEKKYELSFDIRYDSIHIIDKTISINLGILFPFNLVNYNKYRVNLLNNYTFNKSSVVQLLLPFENNVVNCNLIPLENTKMLSSPQYVQHNFNEIEESFHYDKCCIFNQVFYLNTDNNDVVYSSLKKIPIFTGIYDTFNKVYENEYAPIIVTIYNSHKSIREYDIEVEIQGISYKKIQKVYVEPYSIGNFKIAPQLIEEKVENITSNVEKDINIIVRADNIVVYENSEKCLIYPKEIFVEKLENSRKDWKIDCRSFLARWVIPNAKCIDEIVSRATVNGDVLGGITPDLLRCEEDIKKIYDTLSDLKYTVRSKSFSEGNYHTQRISLPQQTMNLKSGNCIDLSILLASCFEAIKLKTYIVLIPNHALVMVELNSANRICIESTGLGHKEYSEAVRIGVERYQKFFDKNKNPLDDNAYLVDIENARKSQIYPMS